MLDFLIVISALACALFLIIGIARLIFKKHAKKYFLIALGSLVVFLPSAIISGNKIEEEKAQEAQMQKEREARIEKKPAKTASAEVENPTFSFVEASAIVLKMANSEADPEDGIDKSKFVRKQVMKGYLATKMKKHVYTFTDTKNSGEWTKVTFSDDDKKVVKVEMSPNLEKKAVAFNKKEADKEKEKETAKKEEAKKKANEQKQAEEQKKQEETKKLEEQKAQEEAQAKAAEEKRKQEETNRIAEEKRVAEQKQKEQEALQAKQQAEAEQARKEAEEKAQAEAQAQQQQQTQTATFQNCTDVRAAGRAPIRAGEPGFQSKFDRDGDGIGCDQ
ncbi:excalibur calcium-binding domain-containing protein [Priestia megaterium]|uniref:excalibur calcium-binding domain-containing protein n=1 Tax=Priestia megaterium TaxID=1404 RepID=UPI00112E8375|nr:excalibur calcium-binding domain-containing protein [Priestia megaterium]